MNIILKHGYPLTLGLGCHCAFFASTCITSCPWACTGITSMAATKAIVHQQPGGLTPICQAWPTNNLCSGTGPPQLDHIPLQSSLHPVHHSKTQTTGYRQLPGRHHVLSEPQTSPKPIWLPKQDPFHTDMFTISLVKTHSQPFDKVSEYLRCCMGACPSVHAQMQCS